MKLFDEYFIVLLVFLVVNCNICLQCFPEGTDMTSVLDLYFQVSFQLKL